MRARSCRRVLVAPALVLPLLAGPADAVCLPVAAATATQLEVTLPTVVGTSPVPVALPPAARAAVRQSGPGSDRARGTVSTLRVPVTGGATQVRQTVGEALARGEVTTSFSTAGALTRIEDLRLTLPANPLVGPTEITAEALTSSVDLASDGTPAGAVVVLGVRVNGVLVDLSPGTGPVSLPAGAGTLSVGSSSSSGSGGSQSARAEVLRVELVTGERLVVGVSEASLGGC